MSMLNPENDHDLSEIQARDLWISSRLPFSSCMYFLFIYLILFICLFCLFIFFDNLEHHEFEKLLKNIKFLK
jgi:hypothetical protein